MIVTVLQLIAVFGVPVLILRQREGARAHIRHDRYGVFLGHCRRGGSVSLPEGRAGRPAERRCRADRQLCMHRARHSAIDVRHKSRRCTAARKAGAHLVCASAACRERRCCGFGTDARGRLPVGTAACRDGRGHVYRRLAELQRHRRHSRRAGRHDRHRQSLRYDRRHGLLHIHPYACEASLRQSSRPARKAGRLHARERRRGKCGRARMERLPPRHRAKSRPLARMRARRRGHRLCDMEGQGRCAHRSARPGGDRSRERRSGLRSRSCRRCGM